MCNDKTIQVELDDHILHHRLNTIAAQYSTPVNRLINLSIQRLIDDVEFVRGLRRGDAGVDIRQDK